MLLSAEGAAHRGSVHAPSAAETATA
jgi:hypothetical protein